MKVLLALYFFTLPSLALALESGKMAPEFKLGKISLAALKGKIIVLEWLNYGCPFVKKHYDSGNMQALQKKYTDMGIVWLSIISSAPGKQGYVNEAQAAEDKRRHNSMATEVLLDPEGKVGRLYSAKATPHMFIINKQGALAYQGAIDNVPDAAQDSIKGAKNFVAEALDEVLAGQEVSRPSTKAYGCSIKYAN